MRVVNLLESPIVSYIIMGIFSSVAALIFFLIGGGVARVTGQENTLIKVGFEAGGALAGFVIIFLLSFRVITNLRKMTPEEQRSLREYVLHVREDTIDARGLICRYMLYDTETGDWGAWKQISYTREAGAPKIQVTEMEERHIIRIRLEDGRNNIIWESEEDYPYGVSPVDLKRLPT